MKMKIAFLSRHYGKTFRGAEIFTHELSTRLAGLKFEVGIFPDSRSLPQFFPDIVISTNGRLDVIQAKLWTVAHKKKLVITGQSGPGFDDRINVLTFPDVFVALTSTQAVWAQRVNPWVKIVTIPNGVDLQKFNPQTKPLKVDLARPIILSVGADDPIKRLHLLKAAVKKTDHSLLVVGQGGDMIFSHQQMPNIYTACDLFSYPTSPWESFGISILEAMASGLPVVVTDDQIRREIVGNAGLFVDPTDTIKYAQTLETALKMDWGNKPRDQATKFSWDKIAQQYEKLLNSL